MSLCRTAPRARPLKKRTKEKRIEMRNDWYHCELQADMTMRSHVNEQRGIVVIEQGGGNGACWWSAHIALS